MFKSDLQLVTGIEDHGVAYLWILLEGLVQLEIEKAYFCFVFCMHRGRSKSVKMLEMSKLWYSTYRSLLLQVSWIHRVKSIHHDQG